ncbi:unknown_gene_9940 [Phodopus roborovskii]|uniref:Unknown_gene_9940 protein n=1 Tax=Phodopus roborovskii TaxID=109678 RepID=A0AAU9Z046_PHORO|nr:unknown_gene_9940 [Phodopus roborovskii]
MAARGPLPPGPGHRKPRATTWWARAGNPQRKRSNLFWVSTEPGILGPLQAYVSAPQPHGPLELIPQSSCEVRRPARFGIEAS